jgi:M3 family oligoendopeptidase
MLQVKFSEIEYKKQNFEDYEAQFKNLLASFEKADTLDVQKDAMRKINELSNEYSTNSSLVYIRHSIDTRDEFYEKEQNYLDEIGPKVQNLGMQYHEALTKSKFRKELIDTYGVQLFDKASLSSKVINDTIIQELQEENRLVTEYDKLIASASILFEGEERNLSGFSPFMQSTDRKMRKKATDTRWGWYASNKEKLDEIFDKLVKVRHTIALKLGYNSFTEVGYARMGRTDYGSNEVAGFRDSIHKNIVPLVLSLKERQRKRLGLDRLEYYDQSFMYNSGNPTPKGNPDWILENGKKMYNELSPETKEFFSFMTDHELMDLVNKKGKQSGGYCTFLPTYKAPFIFSNFNGTSHDIDVLTHEAGHAFQVYNSKDFEVSEYFWSTSESAEIHSMSMEFFTWQWMELFFKEDTNKYKFEHLAGSLNFLPYGTAVDEFQHVIYSNPEMTPDERNKTWREIEKKYLPFRNYDGIEYLDNGGFWQQQAHIFASPFYYIDYVLAQVCAFQFWVRMQSDFNDAWKDYVILCKAGGSKPFLELVKLANLKSPFEESTIKNTIDIITDWLNKQDDSNY